MERTHFGQHGDECFGCKLRSVAIGLPSDLPTRKPEYAANLTYRKTREKDIAAYKRLRKEGLTVRGTTGAARLEQGARTKFELESGRVADTPALSRRYEEANNEIKERMVLHAKEVAASK